ncbi:PG2 pseudoGTPase domain-containing protein [Aphelenchoides besseyi]|nr:PG2 pseudoGTPase domain-containing protein [Aphelenchoides besseyi]
MNGRRSGGSGGSSAGTAENNDPKRQRVATLSVLGLSGTDSQKGVSGVGKSVFCNRLTDFATSNVCNNEHWLFHGELALDPTDHLGPTLRFRIIEHTTFIDDESFEPLGDQATALDYQTRALQTHLQSTDRKLAYICPVIHSRSFVQSDQLGAEADYVQIELEGGKCEVDAFAILFDVSHVPERSLAYQSSQIRKLVSGALETKRPTFLLASKCDAVEVPAFQEFQRLVQRKDFQKHSNFYWAEISSIENVNCAEFLYLLAQTIDRPRSKPSRLPSFVDAQRLRNNQLMQIRTGFKTLLEDLLPQEEFPLRHGNFPWPVLLEEFSINQHPIFMAFVAEFGINSAKRLYDEHIRSNREFWLERELSQSLPLLSETLKRMFSSSFLCQVSWEQMIVELETHPSYETYFQPYGRSLDRFAPKLEVDNRIPSEVLQKPEARQMFQTFQKELLDEIALERQIEKFKRILEKKEAVTPGRSFADVKVMCEEVVAFEDVLPPDFARYIYEEHQKELKKRAERDFNELLLENLVLFVDLVVEWRLKHSNNPNRVCGISERDYNIICATLIEDKRFRDMSGLSSRRRELTSKMASFMSMPLTCFCFAGDRCADLIISSVVGERRREQNKFCAVNADVYGALEIVDEFIAAVNFTLPSDRVFYHNDKVVKINCERAVNVVNDFERKRGSRVRTPVCLLSSVEIAKQIAQTESPFNVGPAPIFVGVLTRDAKETSTVQSMGKEFADQFGGVFISIDDTRNSSTSLVNSPLLKTSPHFTVNQLEQTLHELCAGQIGTGYADLNIRMSFLCDDPLSIAQLLAPLLEHSSQTDDTGGRFCLDVHLPSEAFNVRVCISPASYHNWLMSKWQLNSLHGHILVFSPSRFASWKHAETALNLLLDAATVAGPQSSSVLERQAMARSILLVAVEDPSHFFTSPESSHFLSEGSKLAERIGCRFVAISPSMPIGAQYEYYTNYFASLLHNQQQPNSPYTVCSQNSSTVFASKRRPTYCSANVTSFTGSASTLLTSSSASQSNLSESVASAIPDASSTSLVRNQHHAANRPHDHVTETPPILADHNHLVKITTQTDRPTPSGSLRSNQSGRRPVLIDSSLNASVYVANGPEIAKSSEMSSNRFRRPLSAIGSLMSGSGFSTQPSPDSYLQTSAEETSNNNISPNDGHSNKIKFSPSGFRKLFQRSNAGSESSVDEQSRKKASSKFDPLKRRSVHEKAPEVVNASELNAFTTLIHVNPDDSPPRSPTKKSAKKPLRKVLKSLSVESFDEQKNGVVRNGTNPTTNGVRFAADVENIPTSGVLDLSTAANAEFERPSRLRRFADRLTRRSKNHAPRRQSLPPKRLDCTNLSSPTSASSNSPLEMSYESECKNGDEIPTFVRCCIEFIQRNNGLLTEGIYRLNGHPVAVAEMEKQFRKSGTLTIESLDNKASKDAVVIAVSAALKRYLGSFSEPLIPSKLNDEILSIFADRTDIDDRNPLSTRALDLLRRLFARELPNVNRRLLAYVCAHLERVAENHERNRMTGKNLALIWAGTIFRLPNQIDMAEASNCMARLPIAIYFFIKHHAILF